MSKTRTLFACQKCAAQYPKWVGQCMECGAWNSLVEEIQTSDTLAQKLQGYAGTKVEVCQLPAVTVTKEARASTGLEELDQVLGGGLVSGSVVLLGGDPGIGKSTLLLEVLCHLAKRGKVLYVTGEESLQQIKLRSERLELSHEDIFLLADTQVERIIEIAQKEKPSVMVIDSIQTTFTQNLSAAPGSVSQVRESAAQLVRFAKQSHTAVFLVGHVTKEGALAGPRVLEHMVDVVLYFEGERSGRLRMLRAVKNRFGAVNELGVFAMTDKGLKGVSNPSAIFITREKAETPGSIIMVAWEGSRPLLVEVQALVDETHLEHPRRVAVGLDHNRLAMLLAVLHRHGRIPIYKQDVFINIVGGLRISETASDLAVLAAIVSSFHNQRLPSDLVIFGEVGLGGEIRPVQSGQERLKEAQKQGFTRAIIPKSNLPKKMPEGMQVLGVSYLVEALAAL